MIRYRAVSEARTWYVIFDQPRTNRFRWIRFFTGYLFSHCYAVTEAGEGVIIFEPLAWGLYCSYYPIKLEAALEDVMKSDTTALLSVTVEYIKSIDNVPRGLYTCVSSVKALLGLRKCPFTITPFQLYKRLCRHEGCIALKPYIPYVGRH